MQMAMKGPLSGKTKSSQGVIYYFKLLIAMEWQVSTVNTVEGNLAP